MDAEEIQKWDKKDVLKMLPAILFAALIFYLSSLPSPVPTEAAEAIDFDINTILHIAEYAVLSFLLAFGLISKTENYNIIIIGVIYAFTDEIHQYFVPNRYFDIFDVIADCIGVLVGLIGYFILLALINRLELVLNKQESAEKIAVFNPSGGFFSDEYKAMASLCLWTSNPQYHAISILFS